MSTITLHLNGIPSQTVDVEFLRVENNCAIVRGYLGDEERYSLATGKRLDANWDFWHLSPEDIKRLRKSE